ncbi:MAG: GNVR domain-containing protein, partial [Candidatus Eisenbacteria bacterium]|nr:GNVR domain-containing protein [Candidatus Eisenbacteria bacterium]
MEIRPNVREARDLRGMVTMVWRRKWVVLAPVLAGLLAGFVIGHPKVLPPVYESTARILVDFPAPVTKDLQGILPSSGMQEQIARLSALVQSNDFLLKVASQSRLREDPEVKAWVNSNARRYPGLSQEELENICIPELLRHWIGLRIAENILTIRVVHADPLRAQDLAQRVATGVIEANSSAQLERVKEMYRFSEMQMAVYKQELADAEKSLDDAKRSAALGALRASGNSAGLTEVRRLRDEASSESARLSTEEQRLRRSIQSKAPSALAALPSAGGPAYSRVVEQVKDLERKYAEAAADPYGSQNDAETYAVLTAQALGDLQQEAIEQWEGGNAIPASVRSDAAALLVTQARMAGVRERLGALDRAISRSESSVTGTPAIETEVQRLTREVENKRALYNAFVNQLASSKIGEAFVGSMEQGRMSILEPPARPLSPIKPNRPVILVLGGIIGLLLGIAALAIVERQDPTFRDSREAERALGIRVIGTLPQLDMLGAAKDRPHWTQQAFDRFLGDSPAYQEMRRIALELRNDEDAPVRSLLITSTRGGEGKTTACIPV